METAIQTHEQDTASLLQDVLIKGDLAKLSEVERVNYYSKVCDTMGLNPFTKPFEFIQLNGKLTMYATRNCTEQLRRQNGVAIKIVSRENLGDIYVVTAQAQLPDGRFDESTGAVFVKGLGGENLANAYMKAETKAKRRVTLSICGLSTMDESEDGEWSKETNKYPKNEHAKDVTEFASDADLKALETLVGSGADNQLLMDKEVEYYEARIALTRRGTVREQKGNRAAIHCYTPTNISFERSELERLLDERRNEVPVEADVVQVETATEAQRETMEAMKQDARFNHLPNAVVVRFNEILTQIEAGEVVEMSKVQTAINWTEAKMNEVVIAEEVKTEEVKPKSKKQAPLNW